MEADDVRARPHRRQRPPPRRPRPGARAPASCAPTSRPARPALEQLAAHCVATVDPAPRYAVPDVDALGPVPEHPRRDRPLPRAARPGRRRRSTLAQRASTPTRSPSTPSWSTCSTPTSPRPAASGVADRADLADERAPGPRRAGPPPGPDGGLPSSSSRPTRPGSTKETARSPMSTLHPAGLHRHHHRRLLRRLRHGRRRRAAATAADPTPRRPPAGTPRRRRRRRHAAARSPAAPAPSLDGYCDTCGMAADSPAAGRRGGRAASSGGGLGRRPRPAGCSPRPSAPARAAHRHRRRPAAPAPARSGCAPRGSAPA